MIEFLFSKTGIYMVYSMIVACMFITIIHYKQKATIAQLSVIKYSQLLDEQNEAILNIKKQSDAASLKQAQLLLEIDKERAQSFKQVDWLQGYDVPMDCEQAIKWGISQVNK